MTPELLTRACKRAGLEYDPDGYWVHARPGEAGITLYSMLEKDNPALIPFVAELLLEQIRADDDLSHELVKGLVLGGAVFAGDRIDLMMEVLEP